MASLSRVGTSLTARRQPVWTGADDLPRGEPLTGNVEAHRAVNITTTQRLLGVLSTRRTATAVRLKPATTCAVMMADLVILEARARRGSAPGDADEDARTPP